jgi:hypothetical protein
MATLYHNLPNVKVSLAAYDKLNRMKEHPRQAIWEVLDKVLGIQEGDAQ